MVPGMGADLYGNNDGFEGTIPDDGLYPPYYFDSNNSFATQTLNDVKWESNPADGQFPQPCNNAFMGSQTMTNVNGNFSEPKPANCGYYCHQIS
ncbi:hypothetical protein AQUCO_00900277v1 [Aquilegia coerulea]|uniref:Uncharacterized protein n=1 Tax=Aquilegia coerulea TaxID=218851 RepID=A0A2G5ECU6_AQUCA|nr:hypothetical protein AQUCO_00900277v1 [Aquilegia coerulea]